MYDCIVVNICIGLLQKWLHIYLVFYKKLYRYFAAVCCIISCIPFCYIIHTLTLKTFLKGYLSKMGPIVIVEDDKDDQEIFRTVIKDLDIDCEIIFHSNAEKALKYLQQPKVVPFIVFSDINMPGMNGFQLRDMIHDDPPLRIKCIPFIFLTTGGAHPAIREAYSKDAQGYFIKPNSINKWAELIALIVNYWKESKKP